VEPSKTPHYTDYHEHQGESYDIFVPVLQRMRKAKIPAVGIIEAFIFDP